MTHRTRAWAILVTTPPPTTSPMALNPTEWFAGRYCFGHDSPAYLEGFRLACFRTRRAARLAAKAWSGPKGETARPLRVTVTIETKGDQ